MRKVLYSLFDALVTYAPLFTMVLLAAATWWLSTITPKLSTGETAATHRTAPDGFADELMVERFDTSGALRSILTGERARHYPAESKTEIDVVQAETTESGIKDTQTPPVLGTPGMTFYRTTAQADTAYVFSLQNIIELHDNAYVTRQPLGAQGDTDKVEFRGNELRALIDQNLLVSDQPVDIMQNGTRFLAQKMVYNSVTNVLDMTGAVRGVIREQP